LRKHLWIRIVIPFAVLLMAGLGCTLAQLEGPAAVVTPTLPPTPTVAAGQATPPPAPPANALEAQVEAVYDQAGPAVVQITSRSVTFDFFMRAVPQEGTGSGFLYDSEGHIVTNFHVVENAESVSVALPSGEVYEAEIVGVDSSTDLAVLRINAERLPDPISLGDSDQLRVGQFVVAIGNPFGQASTLTVGVISALGRIIESPDGRFIGEAIQTDAAINPGNSGGPLLDLQGRVIGVNSQIISPSGSSAGIGFAVSSSTVRRVVPQLIASGRYPHPWLGVNLAPFDAEGAAILRQAGMEIPVEEGLLIIEVIDGAPAAQAGLRGGNRAVRIGNTILPVGGDIVIAIDGTPVTDLKELTVYLDSETRVGDTVDVTLIRNGEQMTVPVRLAERPG